MTADLIILNALRVPGKCIKHEVCVSVFSETFV
jgi:hypothetical protein